MQRDESNTDWDRIDQVCDEFERRWRAGDPPRIETILAEQAGVDRTKLLRQLLLVEVQLRLREGDAPSAADYTTRFPGDAETVQAALEAVLPAGDAAPFAETVDATPGVAEETIVPGRQVPLAEPAGGRRFGDYELLGEIARGGMGVVYRARQTKLNRIVALKMIIGAEYAGHEDVARFRTEAEAAAQLDHPNIVPVHEVGEQDGLHFFSMGLVEGNGLDARLKDGPLPPREAAELTREIAVAIQYAHDKGIVHRDLKPANVLIDAGGKPRITDFGLAKNIGGDSGMTATGQVMGTPSYMPPEQAAGKTDDVGPSADVYSLGALLYALLTGRPPFQAANVMETLKQVCEQDPVSPRELNPAVDRDLETICLKCLEKHAAKRYASAGAFAEDIARYLDGKPILARPIGRPARAWRWCKRNPLQATVAGLIVFLATVGPATAAYQFEINRRLDRALSGERLALARKDKALEETNSAIDRYIQTVKNAELLKEPRFKGLLKLLLKDALAHYRRFVDEHQGEHDEATRLRLALSQFEIGVLSGRIGSHQEAIEASLQALSIYERLARDTPSTEYERRLAECHFNLGALYDQVGQRDNAGKSLNEALRIWQRLSREFPSVREYRSELVNNQSQLAVHHAEAGKTDTARRLLQQSAATLETLLNEEPDEPAHQSRLAHCQYNLGILLGDINERAAAQVALRRSIALWQGLVQRHSAVANYQSGLADAFNTLGVLQFDLGEWDNALSSYRRAQGIQRRLCALHPNVKTYQSALARCCVNLANLCRETGREAEALAASRDTLNILGKLVAENPGVVNYQSELAAAELNNGLILRHFGQKTAALQSCRRAVESYERLVRRNPDVLNHAKLLALSRVNLGILYRETNQDEQATPCFQQALETFSRLAERQPDNSEFQSGVARCHDNLAIQFRAADNLTAAVKSAERAIALWENLVRQHPGDAAHQDGLAICKSNLATIHGDAGNEPAAEECLQTALRIRQQLVRQHPAILQYRVNLAGTYTSLAERQQQSRHFAEALNRCRQAERIYEQLVCAHPQVSLYRRRLAECDNNIGFLSRAIGRRDEALACWQQAVALRERLVQEHPTVTVYQSELAGSYGDLGLIYGEIEKQEESLESHRKAVAVYEQLVQNAPEQLAYQIGLARTHINVAVGHSRAGQIAKVFESFGHSVKLLQPILARRPGDAKVRMLLHTAHRGRAISADKLERFAEAAREWNAALRLSPPSLQFACAFRLAVSLAHSGDHVQATKLSGLLEKRSKLDATAYKLARLFAVSVAAVKRDKRRSTEERMRLSAGYVTQMMALLNRIKNRGYFQSPRNRQALAEEPDFKSLHGNDAFRAFAKSLGIELPMPMPMPAETPKP